MGLPSLVLFARAPEPGRVKTGLYRAFLEDAARAYPAPDSWRSVLYADPGPLDPLLAPLFPAPWLGEAQAAGDLGRRLREAFEREFARGAPAVLAIGSDHPALPRESLARAFAAMARGDGAVLIPAEDGGYCAIGLSAGVPAAEVFREVPWSTAAVLATTLERLVASGIRHRVLPGGYDVDRPEDVDRLSRELAARDPREEGYPVATARALGVRNAVRVETATRREPE
jgi:rSAM/selenodomain-associated transferase 1